jgi:hypothetical protein
MITDLVTRLDLRRMRFIFRTLNEVVPEVRVGDLWMTGKEEWCKIAAE